MNIKIRALKNQLTALSLQGMIVSNPLNIYYLTGLNAEGTLLITPKENAFITDSRYVEAVNTYLTLDQEIVAYDMKNLNKYDYGAFFSDCENVGFEEKYVTYETYKLYLQTYQVNLIETEGLVEIHRTVKENDEIESIEKACRITDKCFEHIIEFIKPGMTDKEIAFEIECYMKKNGADSLAFETIVAAGSNSSMPHAVPTDNKIKEKDIIQFDFGCKVNGYCSDFSRVLFLGNMTDEEKKVYDFVLKTYEKITSQITDGVEMKEILKQVEQDYKENNYDVLHAFGHGIGLYVHEDPILSTKKETKLKKNMMIAIEPGVYIPGKFGIRLENTLLVTKNGCNAVTKSSLRNIRKA